ncbi:MAG: polysaccharide deacetylase family protein [Candidatus Cloacimonadales bacterium]
MKKQIFLLVFIVVSQFLLAYNLPKTLFITSGDGDGRGTVSDGVILAMQELNSHGAIVKLDNRKILYQPQELAQYQILIISTAYGYHDADRLYSLSFLSEIEMINISNWVEQGGILIGDNFLGRNRLDGSDRISQQGLLDNNNWALSKCFQVELLEKNMKDFQVVSQNEKIWQGDITEVYGEAEWTTVISKLLGSESEIWANWQAGNETYPAIVKTNFGKGKAILLANFNLLHPASDGGFSSSEEIGNFYHEILQLTQENRQYPVALHPWKFAKSTAFTISFDDGGKNSEYERILDFVEQNKLQSNFFISNKITTEQLAKLRKSDNINLEMHSYSRADFRKLSYAQTCQELQQNRALLPAATGFRFPLTNNSYHGLLGLEEENMLFDSSIGVNHLEFYRGSIFPYNIPIFSDGYFRSLDLLEISQIFHDDWYFYQKILTDKTYDKSQQIIDSKRFSAYLTSLWTRAILPNKGMMVIMAHPLYSGYSQQTLQPLQDMLDLARKDDSWICSIDQIARHWNQLLDLKLKIVESDKHLQISLHSASNIAGLTLLLPQKPLKVQYDGKYELEIKSDKIFLILQNGKNNDEINLFF